MIVTLQRDHIRIGALAVSFQRTLRIPDDGSKYPLPPSLGTFPLARVDDHANRVPASWRRHGGVFLPMYQREAMWLRFTVQADSPMAVKIGAGKVNALSGGPWREGLDPDDQDYVVVPDQPWIDGFKTDAGGVRQFVAMPLGMGYTVEGQLTGEETVGGIQIEAFPARPGAIPPTRFAERDLCLSDGAIACMSIPVSSGAEMGLGAGGRLTQSIYPDPYGRDVWDIARGGRVFVHIVNSQMYRDITGLDAPPTPISARRYAEHGLPWFSLYDEHKGDIAPSEALNGVNSVAQMDQQHGFVPQQDDGPVAVPPATPVDVVRDGGW